MYKNNEIIKALFYLKSGDILPINDTYNTKHLGFSSDCYNSVQKAVTALYGMRCNWPTKINYKELVDEINKFKE